MFLRRLLLILLHILFVLDVLLVPLLEGLVDDGQFISFVGRLNILQFLIHKLLGLLVPVGCA